MKKLESLTPEQEALMPKIAEKWINIFNNNSTWNDESVIAGVEWVYELSELKKPTVVIVDSPHAAQAEAKKYTGKDKNEHSSYLSYSDCGWLAYHDFFHSIGHSDHENYKKYRDLMQNGVYYSILLEEVAIVSKPPIHVHQTDENNLHDVNDFAIKFRDNTGFCAVNGRDVEDELIFGEITFDMFKEERNEDIKAAMVTIIKERGGDQALLKFLGAVMVDEKKLHHNEEHVETLRLYKTKERYDFIQDHHGNLGQPYCWSEMTCPSTGQVYLIENSAAFDDAIEAAKFLRPAWVPADIDYSWSQFAN